MAGNASFALSSNACDQTSGETTTSTQTQYTTEILSQTVTSSNSYPSGYGGSGASTATNSITLGNELDTSLTSWSVSVRPTAFLTDVV
jgi:hypothetical protein